jgi:hypothetical protein
MGPVRRGIVSLSLAFSSIAGGFALVNVLLASMSRDMGRGWFSFCASVGGIAGALSFAIALRSGAYSRQFVPGRMWITWGCCIAATAALLAAVSRTPSTNWW